MKLPGDADAFKPALSDGFGFFHQLFGGSNHSPIARTDSFYQGGPMSGSTTGFVERSRCMLWNSALLVGPDLLASPLH